MERKNFLQSAEFARWRELCGDEVVRVADNYLIVKNARRGRHGEVAGAVVVGGLAGWSAFAQALRAAGQTAGCVFIRVRPQTLATDEGLAALARAGFRPATRHLYAENTVILDLSKSEEALLAEMRKQTRYEIKHLDRHPKLKIELVETEQDWQDFAAMQAETARRQGFVASSARELLNLREAFGKQALLYKASTKAGAAEAAALAFALIIISSDEADYFEAASTEAARELPVAYALQWRVIRDLKKRGVARYNLFGIAPEGAKTHRYSKLTTFKRGFGGEVVNYLPAHDLPLQRGRYGLLHLYELVEKWRRKW